jgi:hypothetical protein
MTAQAREILAVGHTPFILMCISPLDGQLSSLKIPLFEYCHRRLLLR